MLLVRHLTDGSFGRYFTKVMECCVDFFLSHSSVSPCTCTQIDVCHHYLESVEVRNGHRCRLEARVLHSIE